MAARFALAAPLLAVLVPRAALGARVRHNSSNSVGTGTWEVEKTLGGVPIYNYAYVQKPRKRSDGVVVTPAQTWVLKVFDNVSTAEAEKVCNDGPVCFFCSSSFGSSSSCSCGCA